MSAADAIFMVRACLCSTCHKRVTSVAAFTNSKTTSAVIKRLCSEGTW